jgi:6-methylsalicylate decarboxylase
MNVSRREALKTMVAAGAAAALPRQANAPARRGRIDVHHHLMPPFQDGGNRNWTPQVSLDAMGKFNVETAILSATMAPCCGVADLMYAGTEAANTLVRRYNDYGAQIVRDNPKRFGQFASLPLMDQNATLKEIEYAYDTLKVDGITMFSNTGEKWLGDPMFIPTWEALNRRKAIVFIHPSVAKCCRTLVPGVGVGVVEFDFDTTRTMVSMLYSGRLAQFPDVRFIINHTGAALPALGGRIVDELRENEKKVAPNGGMYELRKLYFECAHASFAMPMAAAMKLAPTTQLLFGTDFPVWSYETTVDRLPEAGLTPEVLRQVERGNAEKLFPRFA